MGQVGFTEWGPTAGGDLHYDIFNQTKLVYPGETVCGDYKKESYLMLESAVAKLLCQYET